jgi:hypothetical protein
MTADPVPAATLVRKARRTSRVSCGHYVTVGHVIARHADLSNSHHAGNLPASWTTLATPSRRPGVHKPPVGADQRARWRAGLARQAAARFMRERGGLPSLPAPALLDKMGKAIATQ